MLWFNNDTEKCMKEIKKLSDDDNLLDIHLEHIRRKYPNELHSWKRELNKVKIVMYKM